MVSTIFFGILGYSTCSFQKIVRLDRIYSQVVKLLFNALLFLSLQVKFAMTELAPLKFEICKIDAL
jgi:hypothetical protein